MAWTRKLPSGKWQGQFRDAQNRPRSAGSFAHKARAMAAAVEAESRARGSFWRDIDSGRQPWGRWADEEWWPARTVAPSTASVDRRRLENHLRPKWGQVPIASITRTDVKRWAADLRAGGMGPETVRRCVHLLSASLVAAVDAEVLQANPAARITLPTGGTDKERFLTREEYARLQAALATDVDRLIVDMLVYTGLRWGELAGLHRARVDTGRQMIRVVESWDESAQVMSAYPKGKRSRDVPLTRDLADRIEAMAIEGDDECGLPHSGGRCPGRLLITAPGGSAPLRNSNWTPRSWKPAVEHAKLHGLRKHDLRHTYASWLLQAGVPLAEVGRLLGHTSPVTTDRYAHLAEAPSAVVLGALEQGSAARLLHDGSVSA